MADKGTKVKLSKRTVDAALPTDKLYCVWDSDLKGFGLRVMPTGVKTYFVMYRPNGGGRNATAKRFTIGKHGAVTPDEARKQAERLLSGVRLGSDPQAEKNKIRADITMTELCDLYIQEGMTTKAASTVQSDTYRINSHIKPLLGRKRVGDIDTGDIERFLKDVATGKHTEGRKPTIPEAKAKGIKVETRKRNDSTARGGKGTATRTMILLSAIFSWAVKRKARPDNPCKGVSKFKPGTSERYLTIEEIGRLGDALDNPKHNPKGVTIIRALILTGCRKSEIQTIKRDQIDAHLSFLKINGKNGYKPVAVGAAAIEVLTEAMRSHNDDYVFPSDADPDQNGKRGHFIGLPKVWNKIRKEAGLEDVRLHDLRHTFASMAVSDGKSLPIISKILGHTNIKTTQRYAHLADDPVKAAAEETSAKAANALKKNRKPPS